MSGPRRGRPTAGAGFTLVELMVTLALGLAVVGALIASSLASLGSGRRTEALIQMTEDAMLVQETMRQQVSQAGFGLPRATRAGGLVLPAIPAVAGCRAAGFVDLRAEIAAPANCEPPGTPGTAADSLEVGYEASVLGGGSSNAILGGPGSLQPLDCLGNAFAPTHDAASAQDFWQVDSKFYVADGSLHCHGPGNAAGEALANNVETMRVTYGIAGSPGASGGGQVSYYDDAPPPGDPRWDSVVSVRLCLQFRSTTPVLDPHAARTLGAWIDCDDIARTAADGYLRRSFATTVLLHNRVP